MRLFKSRLPSELTVGLDKHNRHIYDSLDVIQQQNDAIIQKQSDTDQRLDDGDTQFQNLHKEVAAVSSEVKNTKAEIRKEIEAVAQRVSTYDRIYLVFTSKKAVITGFVGSVLTFILIPIGVIVVADKFIHRNDLPVSSEHQGKPLMTNIISRADSQ